MRRILAASLLCLATLAQADFTLTILHTNDCHARVEATMIKGKSYGGYARMATFVKERMAKDKNPILLSAGDVFQGTMYFNVYEGLADLAFMNSFGYTAMALGNHEFDKGPATLSRFIKHANFPVLCANADFSKEPELRDKVKPSTVVTIGKQRIGLVGAVTEDLPSISSPGENIAMKDLVTSVQAEVDKLTKEGIDKIVLVTHCGYEVDTGTLVSKVKGIDVIVGGHSHSLLGQFENPDFPKSLGPYPTVSKGPDGNTVLIVQAWEWGKVIGRLEVKFDDKGKVKSWSKEQPRILDETVPEDPVAASFVAALQKPILAAANEVVGQTDQGIVQGGNRTSESPMGNVIADAQLEYTKKAGSDFAMMNGGGIRATIEPGPITFAEAVAVQPFNNTLTLLDLTGDEIRQTLEIGVKTLPEGSGALVHVSAGCSYEVDLSKPGGSRITKVQVNGAPLDPARTYTVVLNTFMANGGDGHTVLKGAKGKRIDTGLLDIDAFVSYLKAHRPTEMKDEGRIVISK